MIDTMKSTSPDHRLTEEFLTALHYTCLEARQFWWALFRDADSWSDPDKRRQMLQARLCYQDAMICYALALRS